MHEKFLKEERVSAKMLKSTNKQLLRQETLGKQSAIKTGKAHRTCPWFSR
jgi:hypothetical protein